MASTTRETQAADYSHLPIGSSGRRAVTFRSVGIGSLIAVLVCGLTPFNDYVVANTFMVGSYLPVVMVLAFFLLVVVFNALLLRWVPSQALSTRELAVVMLMTLVACSLPSQGFLRAFIPTLVAPFWHGSQNQKFWDTFLKMQLPGWLFPVEDIRDGRSSDIVSFFYTRVQPGEPVPYSAWVVPMLGWGVFFGSLFATLVALAWLVRQQWGVNERLPFPLVQLQYSLIEQPQPGRCLNSLFLSRMFWIALGIVFALHSLSALNMYWPKHFPKIPLQYDLTAVFSERPWSYLPTHLKRAPLYFTFIGVTYFIHARTAFSLWAIYVIAQLVGTQQRMMQSDITAQAWRDQHLGASLVYVAGFIWVGRPYWWNVLRSAVGAAAPQEVRGASTHHRAALVIAVGGVVVMVAWLCVLHVSWWIAALIVLFLLLPHIVTARIVAETGLCFIRSTTTISQLYTNLSPGVLSGRDVFFSGVFAANGAFQTREGLLTYALHGMRTCDMAEVDEKRDRSRLAMAIVWTLVLGMFVGTWSSLYCYYSYATPISQPRDTEHAVINNHGLIILPREEIIDPMARYGEGRFPQKTHSPWLNFGSGVVITGLLQAATWRLAWWPFVPVGYVTGTTNLISLAWFSLMIGWMAKVLILRFGGSQLFVRVRPIFIGIIFGEALAAGFWLLVNLALAANGLEYEPIRFLPS